MQGIYSLQFKGIDQVYVGKSSLISQRYKEHCRKLGTGTHNNTKLLEVYNKIKEYPELTILEEVPEYLDLSIKEIYWINKLNSFTGGFNLTKGGDIEFGEGSPASKYTDKQYYEVLFKLAYSNDTYDKISLDTGVHRNTINNLVSQKSQLHLKELYPELYELMLLKKGTKKYKVDPARCSLALYDLINTDSSIPDIQRKYSLTSSNIHGILNGKYTFLDAKLVETARKLRPVNLRINFKGILLKHPNGSIHTIDSTQKDFAEKHNIDRRSLSQLLRGKLKSTAGWTLV